MNTLDTDRSGRLSFEEFAFRQVDSMQDGATALTTLTPLTLGHSATGLGVSCRWRWLVIVGNAPTRGLFFHTRLFRVMVFRRPKGHPPRTWFTS